MYIGVYATLFLLRLGNDYYFYFQTPDDLADSYERLISHLTSHCKTDVEKVRAIFIWMANQDIDGADYSNVTGNDTPRGVMKLMKENKASYSSFFALLCR